MEKLYRGLRISTWDWDWEKPRRESDKVETCRSSFKTIISFYDAWIIKCIGIIHFLDLKKCLSIFFWFSFANFKDNYFLFLVCNMLECNLSLDLRTQLILSIVTSKLTWTQVKIDSTILSSFLGCWRQDAKFSLRSFTRKNIFLAIKKLNSYLVRQS